MPAPSEKERSFAPDWEPKIGRGSAKLKLEPTREAIIVEGLVAHLDDGHAEWRSGATEDEDYRAASARRRWSVGQSLWY